MNDIFKLLKREVEPFEVKAAPLNQIYQCTIDDDFTDVRQFAQLVDYLNNACLGDIAHIKLSTNGGALHAIIPLIEAMRTTEAHIALHVESDTASAGTILMMLADEVYINPYTTVMIHTASYGFYSHSGNMDANVTHSTKAIKKLVSEVYENFLTEAEISRVLDGKEFYLTDEDCHERFELRETLRAEQADMEDAEKVRAELDKLKDFQSKQEVVDVANAIKTSDEFVKAARKPRKKAQEA